MTAMPVVVSEAEERVSVAPNWLLVWWRFRKNKLALFSSVVLILICIVALFPGFFSTQDPQESTSRLAFIPLQTLHFFDEGRFQPFVYGVVGNRDPKTLQMKWAIDTTKKIPVQFLVKGYTYEVLGLFSTDWHLLGVKSEEEGARPEIYLMGTDRLGRDQWSRLTYGIQTSISIGVIGVILSVILGVLLGGISGYVGGLPDTIIQRVIELLQSLPTIPIWMAMTAALPRDWPPSKVYFAITVILSLIGWTTLGREVRGRFLSLREEDFVVAAQLSGCSQLRIITHHMVPAFASHIIATSTLAIPSMIISETAHSFLGLGLRAPAISLGVLLQEAQTLQAFALAHWLLYTGIAVILIVLTLNLIGDGLRDAADPYSN